jgi:LAGLIDADG-like domain
VKQIQRRWSDQEKEVIKENYGKLTYKQISLILPERNWMQVRNQARTLSLTGHSNLGRKYSTNKGFFSTPGLLNSYWAGFIAADGCIIKNKLCIGLARLDTQHVQRFVEDVSYTGKISYREKVVSISVCCEQYAQDLRNNFSITERKTLSLMPPNIENEDLVAAYITGLIDGDGSISYKRPGNLCITIYGTRFILNWVKYYFERWSSDSKYRRSDVRNCKDGRNLSYYSICSSRAKEVYKRLSIIEIPRLSRKWSKFI